MYLILLCFFQLNDEASENAHHGTSVKYDLTYRGLILA